MEFGQHPDVWTEIHVKHAGGTNSYVYGMGPYADPSTYHHGWKSPQLLDVGEVEYAASNAQQQYQAASMPIQLQDSDFGIQTNISENALRWALGQEALAYIIPRGARFAGTEPTLLLRGLIRERSLPRRRRAGFVIEDVIGAQYGKYSLDKNLMRTVPQGDFPNAPPNIIDQFIVPRAYGEHTDFGTTLADGTPWVKGMLPAEYVGDYDVSSTTITPTTTTVNSLLAPLSAPMTYTTFGPGGSTQWTFALSVRTQYGETTLGGFVTVSGAPSNSQLSPSNGIILHANWAQYTTAEQSQIIGARLWVKLGDINSTEPWNKVDGAGEAFNTAPNTPFQAGPYYHSGGVGFEANGDDSFFKGGTPPTSNTAIITKQITVGVTTVTVLKYRMFLVAQGYVNITRIYASPVTANQTGPQRVYVPPTSPDFIYPGQTGWPLADPWYVVNGRRYSVFLGIGPRADMALTGNLSTAVDACGYTGTGGVGNMIDGVFDQGIRFLNDFLFANDGNGYDDGNWPALITFPKSTSVEMINTASFMAAKAYTISRIGGIGWLGHIYINKQITLREFLRKFAEQFNCYFYPNRFGQICCGIIDPTATATRKLRDHVEIQYVDEPAILDSYIQNRTPFAFDYDFDINEMRQVGAPITDATSKAYHWNRYLGDDQRLEMDWVRDSATATDVATHRNMVYRYALKYWPIYVHFGPGLNMDIGEYVEITSGERNIVNQKMLVLGRRIRPPKKGQNGYVRLTCLDLTNIVP